MVFISHGLGVFRSHVMILADSSGFNIFKSCLEKHALTELGA